MISPQVDYREFIVDRAKFAAMQRLPRYLVDAMDVRVLESVLDDMIAIHVVGYILRSKLLEDSKWLTVEGVLDKPEASDWQNVMVELPRTWWQWLTRRPATKKWLPVVGQASVRVHGRVQIRAEYFALFPYAQVPASPTLGPATLRIPITVDTPYWADPDDVY